MENLISAERLRQLLDYDPATGVFTWKSHETMLSFRNGKAAGCKVPEGYIKIRVDKQLYLAHRLAWLYVTGEWPAVIIDHVNGVRDDNRLSNLRSTGHWLNTYNSNTKESRKDDFRGVMFLSHNGRWRSGIRINGKQFWLGCFGTKEEAIAARIAGEKILYSGVYAPNKNGGRSPLVTLPLDGDTV